MCERLAQAVAAGSSPACRGRSPSRCSPAISAASPSTRAAAARSRDAASAFSLTALNAETGRQHQALLRAADRHVDAPLVMAEVDRGQRGDRVDDQQRGMAGGVHRRADLGDAAGDAGRRLVVDDARPP